MKKQSLILLIFVSFFLFGCPSDDNRGDRYYTIENQSNHPLILKFYNDNVYLDYFTTSLPNNGDKITKTTTYTFTTENIKIPMFAFRSDSIVIEFDNAKRQIYTVDFINKTLSEPIERNVFRHENYENLGKDRFLFKITEEDYNNAEDI